MQRDPTATMSPSKLDLWSRCQWAWFARYILGLKRPPSAAMVWGRAHDETANHVYTDKMLTGETPLIGDAVELYAAQWDLESTAVEEWGDDDAGRLLDAGVRLTQLWHQRAARFVTPAAIQVPLRREIVDGAESFDVIGYMDLLWRRPVSQGSESEHVDVIVDHKARRKSTGPRDLFQSTQASAYAFMGGYRRFALHVGTMSGRSVSWKALERPVTDSDAEAFAVNAAKARRQMQGCIQTGDFLTNRSHFLCTRKWCGYWRECEKANGGTVAA